MCFVDNNIDITAGRMKALVLNYYTHIIYINQQSENQYEAKQNNIININDFYLGYHVLV